MKKPLLFPFVLVVACGVQPAPDPADAQETGTQDLAFAFPGYYRTDGATVTPVWGGAAQAVSFENSDPELDAEGFKRVFEAPADVILYGRTAPRGRFLVFGAWRALPGQAPGKGDGLYAASPLNINCLADPCPTLELTRLDASGQLGIESVNLTLAPFVEEAVLQARIHAGRTLLAGTEAKNLKFDASVVYIRLPERVSCPQIRPPPCGKKVATFYREDRCLYFDACVEEGPCPEWFVERTCAKGYRETRFSAAPNACEQLACEPDFFE